MRLVQFRLLSANPDFSRFWWGQSLSALGTSISSIALPLLVLQLTGSPVAAGGVLTVRLLALNLVRLPGGVLADRFSRRTVMILTDSLKAVLWTTPVLLIACHAHSLWPLLVVAVLDGLVSSIYNPSLGAVIRRLVRPTELMSAVSMDQARSYAAGLVGPSVGGALFMFADWAPFAADAVTYLVCAWFASGIRTDLGGKIPISRGMLGEIGVGMRFVLRTPFLRVQTLWSALLNFATSAAFFGMIPLLQRDSVPASTIGIVSALLSAGALVGAALAPRLADRRPYLTLLGCSSLAVLPGAVLTIAPNPVALTGALMLLSALGPVLVVLLTAHVYRLIPDELMARAQSSMLLLGSVIYPFAAVVMGFLLDRYGARTSYLFVAVCMLGCLALCLPRSIRGELAVSPADPEPAGSALSCPADPEPVEPTAGADLAVGSSDALDRPVPAR